MANFLITSPNSLAQGTDTQDLFVLNTALGATVFGNGGADQISAAAATNPTNAFIYGGAGNDSVFLTAGAAVGTLNGFYLGDGSDLMVASGSNLTNASILGGGGNDTINLVAGNTFTNSTINANAGSDYISASGATLNTSFVAAGGDNDTISFNALADGARSTLNGGGGADSLFLSGATFSAGRIDTDTLNDSQFYGNDTLTLNITLTASFVQLGGGADRLTQTLAVSASTIEGGAGLDNISFASLAANGANLIGGGRGVDTISVTTNLGDAYGTIQGGGGADVINVTSNIASAGNLIGGADADAIGLGTIAASWGTGAVAGDNAVASGLNVSYQSFSQSNLDGLDIISAIDNSTDNRTGGTFMLTQSAVNFTAVGPGTLGQAGNTFTVGANGRVTAFSNASTNTLASRAALLDATLGQGATVLFQAAGTNYVFVQGGAAGSGVSNDLVAQLNVGGFVLSGAGVVTGGLVVSNNSAIKINFSDLASF